MTSTMSKEVSSISDVLAALAAVQNAVRNEIADRIAAGEQIGSMSDSEMRARSLQVLKQVRAERTPKKSAA